MQLYPYVFYSPFAPALFKALLPVLVIIALWVLVVKGYALWCAARGGQKRWFIALLLINTLGILEIVYLIWFRPKDSGQKKQEETPVTVSSSAP